MRKTDIHQKLYKQKPMNTLNLSSINPLISNGRMTVGLPITDLVRETIPYFINLTLEEEAERKKWLIDLSGEKNDPDDGLLERNGHGNSDHKFFFHFRPGIEQYLCGQGANWRAYEPFLSRALSVYAHCANAAVQVLTLLDKAMPEFSILDRHYQLPENRRNVLRFLYYKPGNEILAKAHCDRAFGTFHLDESHSGLYLHGNKKVHQVERNNPLFFFGKKAEVLTGNKLRATPHYVKATSSQWRWAAVYFIHLQVEVSDAELERIIDTEKTNYQY